MIPAIAMARDASPYFLGAMLVGLTIALFSMHFRNRERERRHQERLKAMEMGVKIPLEVAPPREPRFALGAAIALWAVSLTVVGSAFIQQVSGDKAKGAGSFALALFILGGASFTWHMITRRKNKNGGPPTLT